jgi:hypothetical protein
MKSRVLKNWVVVGVEVEDVEKRGGKRRSEDLDFWGG